jgi:hypothetical protein
VGPGSILEWADDGDQVVVRRAGARTSEEIHDVLFAEPPAPKSLDALKEGIRRSVKRRHASR